MVITLAKRDVPSRRRLRGEDEPVTLAVLVCSMACGKFSGIPI